MIALGADLDLGGAIVLLEDGRYLAHVQFPIRPHHKPNGVIKRCIDVARLHEVVAELPLERVDVSYLEWPGVVSSNGALRNASQHRTIGNIEAALAVHGIDAVYVDAREWKNAFHLLGRPKKEAIPIANALCETTLTKVKDTPIAEACLVARYGIKYLGESHAVTGASKHGRRHDQRKPKKGAARPGGRGAGAGPGLLL